MMRAARALFAVVVAVPLAGMFGSPPLVDAHGTDGPTPFESVITDVSPALPDGVSVQIIWNDDMIGVIVPAGTTADIPGYEGEPYLRVLDDGQLQFNTLSSSLYLNNDRYSAVAAPQDAVDATVQGAPPNWQSYDSFVGAVSWHDHRIHWMSPNLPETVEADGKVLDWSVPITIDGTEHVVTGTLYVRPSLATEFAIDICGVSFAGKRYCDPATQAPGVSTPAPATSTVTSAPEQQVTNSSGGGVGMGVLIVVGVVAVGLGVGAGFAVSRVLAAREPQLADTGPADTADDARGPVEEPRPTATPTPPRPEDDAVNPDSPGRDADADDEEMDDEEMVMDDLAGDDPPPAWATALDDGDPIGTQPEPVDDAAVPWIDRSGPDSA